MIQKQLRCVASALTALSLITFTPGITWANDKNDASHFATTTPIKHVVVIFQENVSFDHYFATYPHAANPGGEPQFHAKDDTPRANNLLAGGLLDENPNSAQPFRLDPSQAVTCDQNHGYTAEQQAFDRGLMDKFPEDTGTGNSVAFPCPDYGHGAGIVMSYFDGNTVTAYWNYAQHFAMNDNSFSSNFGPSAPGAINLISGNTSGATLVPLRPNGKAASASGLIGGGLTSGALIGDARPGFDDCSNTTPGLANSSQVTMSGQNVGNLLNVKNITWGWFQGGFAPTGTTAGGLAICGQHHAGLAGDDAVTQSSDGDYIPHHSPFEFYQSTSNQHHTRPSDPGLIGTSSDGANHLYDIMDFTTALDEGRLPAVSFLKAGAYQDGHPGYSDPLDEQIFVVNTINAIMQSPNWKETAIIIAYDDSDGWYDHVMDQVISQSDVSDDALTGPGACGVTPAGATPGRCGYGPRQPLLVISPFAKQNYIDHRLTDQSSILRFIEDNWDLGRIGNGSFDAKAGTLNGMFDFDDGAAARKLILDPGTGLVLKQ
jgi:phospholipase C